MSAKLTEAETGALVDSVNLGALPGPEHDFWVTSTSLLIPEVEAILTARMAQAWDEGHETCCDDWCFSVGNPYREVKA